MQIVLTTLRVVIYVILNDIFTTFFLYLTFKGLADIVVFPFYLSKIFDSRFSFAELMNEFGLGTPLQCYKSIWKSKFMKWNFIFFIFMLTLHSIAIEI